MQKQVIATDTESQRNVSVEAFEFVRELASELSASTIELPSFPDVALQVQRVLSENSASTERVVRVLGAEPMLAARVLSMANSAAICPGGKAVTDLRSAVTRLGFDALRAAAVSFAMAQLRRARQYQSIERQLSVLWQHSALVAALCFVIARRKGGASADTAMLTGLVHGVGKLYILTHALGHPWLFGDQAAYMRIVRDWHGNIAKALLENWNMADEIVNAVHSYEDQGRDGRGQGGQLADVLDVADTLSVCKDVPELLQERIAGSKAAARLGLNAEICRTLVMESAEELGALREALGS
ncbi:MAG: HDOD domain-containing protein [Steroidobacteraceae bacterium]